MTHNQEQQNEEEQSFKSQAYLQQIRKEFQEFALVFHYFEHPEQPCEFDQFIKPANSGELDELVEVSGIEDDVERNDGKGVYNEPACQVLLSYLLSVFDDLKVLIVVGRVEDDNDVHQKQEVDDPLYHYPCG